jgi:hypothetical protein
LWSDYGAKAVPTRAANVVLIVLFVLFVLFVMAAGVEV